MEGNSFTIDDIHNMRYANYERTKNMTYKELIEYTRKEAQYGLDILKDMKSKSKQKKR
jgi:hypothetical protein